MRIAASRLFIYDPNHAQVVNYLSEISMQRQAMTMRCLRRVQFPLILANMTARMSSMKKSRSYWSSAKATRNVHHSILDCVDTMYTPSGLHAALAQVYPSTGLTTARCDTVTHLASHRPPAGRCLGRRVAAVDRIWSPLARIYCGLLRLDRRHHGCRCVRQGLVQLKARFCCGRRRNLRMQSADVHA